MPYPWEYSNTIPGDFMLPTDALKRKEVIGICHKAEILATLARDFRHV